jgi:hypothetical protein
MAFKITDLSKDGTENFKPKRFRVVGDRVVEESDVVVYTFNIGDAEDPDLIAGFAIQDWQKSESGRWVYENCVETPYWVRAMDHLSYGYQYRIVARLTKQNETFFKLKFK